MGHCPCFGPRKRKKPSQCEIQDVSNRSKVSAKDEPKDEPTTSAGSATTEEMSVSIDKVLTFTYRELATATKDFREENFIGQGGFGSVFKGKLKGSGQAVAVKKLNVGGLQGEKEFLVEVLMLSLLHHPNLVNLVGYCAEGEQRLLVYQYMPLGSLEDHLHDLGPDTEPLDWNTRMTIAAGAAKGLNYLHTEANPPVIYRDIKSSNILLDEAFQPRLSDFGLAKFGPSGDKLHVTTRVMGTEGYCAPEYALSGKLTMKSDIYSFGVVLLEIVTGRKAMHYVNDRPKYLVEWARPMMKERKNFLQLADPMLKGEFPESVLKNTVELAAMCLREEPKARPCISDVAAALTHLMSRKYNPSLHRAHKARARKVPETPSPDGTTALLSKDMEREKAIAEARSWGEHWRQQMRQPDLENNNECHRVIN